MPRIRQSRLLARAKGAIQFDACDEALATEHAGFAPSERAKRARHADAVAELQAFVSRQVFLDDEILRDVPSARGARQNELPFQFMRVFAAQVDDRLERERTATDDFLLDAGRLV